jgi:hypothetical protein
MFLHNKYTFKSSNIYATDDTVIKYQPNCNKYYSTKENESNTYK